MMPALQMLAGLVAVLAAIGAAAWLARRMGSAVSAHPSLIKAVAALAVGPKERVVVVELGEHWLVLGVAPGSVSALATVARGKLPAAPEAFDFGRILGKARRSAPA
jgi:flagellar protein FliO/FliZ